MNMFFERKKEKTAPKLIWNWRLLKYHVRKVIIVMVHLFICSFQYEFQVKLILIIETGYDNHEAMFNNVRGEPTSENK